MKKIVENEINEEKEVLITSNKDKFINVLIKILLVLLACILSFILIAAITHTAYFFKYIPSDPVETMHYSKDNILVNLLFSMFLVGTLMIIKKIINKINKKAMIAASIIITSIIGVLWVNFVKAPVIGDQRYVITAARLFAENDFENIKQSYFFMHPLQYGCVLGMELIMRLFISPDNITFQFINVGFIAASMYLIYKMTDKIYQKESISKLLGVLYVITLVIPMFNVVVYGNIFGMFFSLLGIYMLMKFFEDYKIRYIVLTSISMLFAIMFKSNYQIIMIAMVISLVIDLIKKFKIKTLICLASIVLFSLIANPLVYKIVEIRTGKEVNSGIPMITYVAMAIQEKTSRPSGWYHDSSNVEIIYTQAEYDIEKTKEKSMEIITERVKAFCKYPVMMIKFYQDKICSTWIEPAFQTMWWSTPGGEYERQPQEYKDYIENNEFLNELLFGKYKSSYLKYLDIVQICIYSLSLVSVVYGIKNNNYNHTNSILLIVFVGGFLFHILWETKSIYVIPYYIMLIPSASNGFEIVNDKINEMILKIKDRKNNKNLKQDKKVNDNS